MTRRAIKVTSEGLDRLLESIKKLPKKPVGPHLTNAKALACVFGPADSTQSYDAAAQNKTFAKYERHIESCLPCTDLMTVLFEAQVVIAPRSPRVKLGLAELRGLYKNLERAECKPIGPHLTATELAVYVQSGPRENVQLENYHVMTCNKCCLALAGEYISTLKMPSSLEEYMSECHQSYDG